MTEDQAPRSSKPERANPAVEAEPAGIGSSSAPDALSREVRLLGSLLGQVIAEQAGEEILEIVERVRKLTIDIRKNPSSTRQMGLRAILEELPQEQLEPVIKSFSLYFHLTNLAEEKHRVRRVRKRARSTSGGQEGSIEAAVRKLLDEDEPAAIRDLLDSLSIGLVLTAHPTEARRRTVLVALRRTFELVDRLDDPRLTPNEDSEIRRRLREEISLLWRTSFLRTERPTVMDEVRTALLFFDETLFRVTPYLYRTVDRVLDLAPWTGEGASESGSGPASDTGHTGTRPPAIGPFLHWGSWVGADRDGHPRVTAAVTREAAATGADHVLRGLEAVATRLLHTVTPTHLDERVSPHLLARLELDRDELGNAFEALEEHYPGEPYRQRFGSIAERLRQTRHRLVNGHGHGASYASPADLLTEIEELQAALVEDGMARVAYGEVQSFRWQVETFGFHAFSLEVRQHSEVHEATLAALRDGVVLGEREVSNGVTAAEVLETCRAIADIQERFGPEACHRYVISFTREAQDVYNVLELADYAGLARDAIDVVPLLETAEALEGADQLLDEILSEATYREHVRARGDHQEVMLGYSDSTKESGAMAAAWLLQNAETKLVTAAKRHRVRLTLFHGRGGAIGRGGGPMNRAIMASAPHSLDGTLKLTEQGEVVADRYANFDIAMRHLAQLTNAVLIASSPGHEQEAEDAQARGKSVFEELAERSAQVYQSLVWQDPAFEAFYVAATPIGELSRLAMGSRPAARGGGAVSLGSLRAIPWVFSWAQARLFLPAWYGMGTAVEAFEREHGAGATESLQVLYRESPFLTGVIDVMEMALAKVDLSVAQRYASLAPQPDAERIWEMIRSEFERTVAAVLRISRRERLLDAAPSLQRSILLRNPYVDSLSELQVLLLGRLRAMPADDPDREELRRLVQLTVSGVAAGLQNTG
ncbi:MAG: phosphoenolpyruvate carboxylase [Candidatus Limnocylindrales bacterium]